MNDQPVIVDVRTGDLVIREVARQLQVTMRETDVVARIGGEEFVVLLPDTNLDAARIAAERARKVLEDSPVVVEGNAVPIRFTASLGIAIVLGDEDTLDALLDRADQGLYAAKRGGRNRVEFLELGNSTDTDKPA